MLLTAMYLKVPETSLILMIYMLCLLLTALGLYFFLKVSRYQLILYRDAIEVHALHGITRLLHAQIKGRREFRPWIELRNRGPRHELWPAPKMYLPFIPFVDVTEILSIDKKPKKIHVHSLLKTDAVFQTWFHAIEDLDARDNQLALDEIAKDSNFGNSETERMQQLATAKTVAKHLKSSSIVIAIFALLFSGISDVAIPALVLLPWAAIALMAWSPGRYQIAEGSGNVRPDLALLFILSSLVLTVYAHDVGTVLLQLTDILVFAAIAAIALTGLIFHLDRFARRRYWVLFFLLLLNGGYGYSTFVLANTKLDNAAPQVYKVEVMKKTALRDKGGYILLLAPWGEQKQFQEVRVTRASYESIKMGGNTCILFHPGALHMPWYQVLPCMK
ncbi:hypothetical protein ACO0LF_26735 [Undibacterium sp. Di27W]|uniref:hypothetical protein n=1 Tax=Undibacterium sp. Di27W TaxID=3413036 RepID=UPI003BF0F12B